MDHVVPLNEQHLRRFAREYLIYYQEDRTHIGLEKSTPGERSVETRNDTACRVQSDSRLGGLHHLHTWTRAAWSSCPGALTFSVDPRVVQEP